MEGEMIFWGRIFYSCFFMVILVSAIGVVVFIEKRLSHSSWIRNILAVIAGLGASLASILMVYEIGSEVALNNRYFLRYSWMTDEMVTRKQSELAFNLSIINLSVLVLEIVVSILGGYIGGKIARQNEIGYGLLIGVGFVVLSISFGYGYFFEDWHNGLNFILIQTARLCSTVLGGYLALVQRKRNQVKLTTTGEI